MGTLVARTATITEKRIKNWNNPWRNNSNKTTIFHTHTQIHKSVNRAMPDPMLSYKHALVMHKLFNTCQPEQEFVNLNFQFNHNQRIQHANFFNRCNYETGKNILLNRLSHKKIDKQWSIWAWTPSKLNEKICFCNSIKIFHYNLLCTIQCILNVILLGHNKSLKHKTLS